MHRFKASRAKEIIAEVLKKRLTGATYHADNTSSWAREIADDIKQGLKGVQTGTHAHGVWDTSLGGALCMSASLLSGGTHEGQRQPAHALIQHPEGALYAGAVSNRVCVCAGRSMHMCWVLA